MTLRQIGHGDSLKAGRVSDAFLAWTFALQRDTDTMRNDGDMIGLAGSWRGFDPALTLSDDVMNAVSAPTLLLWGDNDPFGSVEVAGRVAASLANATLEILPRSGHLPWLDDPRGLADQAASFLGAAPAGRVDN
jgi:pimeloyl-ACP methyl ester carboxylesterase